MRKEELIQLLNQNGIKTDSWKKSIDNLLRELEEGSCVLEIVDQKLLRIVRVAVIFATFDGKTYYAEKDKHALAEKVNKNESFEEACRRGIEEELGITRENIIEIVRLGSFAEKKNSFSYPGITSLYKYEAFHVRISNTPNLNRIDHDGKTLSFQPISITMFREPNSYFLQHFTEFFFSIPRNIEEARSVFGDNLEIKRTVVVFSIYQKINGELLMRVTRRRWHDLNLISTHFENESDTTKIDSSYNFDDSKVNAIIEPFVNKLTENKNEINKNIFKIFNYQTIPPGKELWKALLAYDFYERHNIVINPDLLIQYQNEITFIQISQHEKSLSLYRVILFHFDETKINPQLIEQILSPDGILQIEDKDLSKKYYGIFRRPFSNLSRHIDHLHIPAHDIKIPVKGPKKIPGLFLISNFLNPAMLNELINSLEKTKTRYIPVKLENIDNLAIFVFPDGNPYEPDLKKIFDTCLRWAATDSFVSIYLNLEYLSIYNEKHIPDLIIIKEPYQHDFLGYRCLEKSNLDERKHTGLFIEAERNTIEIFLGIKATDPRIDQLIKEGRKVSEYNFGKYSLLLEYIKEGAGEYISIKIN